MIVWGRGKLTSRFLTCEWEDDEAFVIKQQQLVGGEFSWTYFNSRYWWDVLEEILYILRNTDLEFSWKFWAGDRDLVTHSTLAVLFIMCVPTCWNNRHEEHCVKMPRWGLWFKSNTVARHSRSGPWLCHFIDLGKLMPQDLLVCFFVKSEYYTQLMCKAATYCIQNWAPHIPSTQLLCY